MVLLAILAFLHFWHKWQPPWPCVRLHFAHGAEYAYVKSYYKL